MDVAVGRINLRGWQTFAGKVSSKDRPGDDAPIARVLIDMVTRHTQEEALEALQRELEGITDPNEQRTDN